MEDLAEKVSRKAIQNAGDLVYYRGDIPVYALLDPEIVFYPNGFTSQSYTAENIAAFLRADVGSNPVGNTFTYASVEYDIVKVLHDQSDSNLIVVQYR